MIDINTLIQQALEKAINEAVNTHLMELHQRISLLESKLEDYYVKSSWAVELDESIAKLKRQVNAIDSATAENDEQLREDVREILNELLDNDGDSIIANAVAQAFQTGALTISVDKV